MPSPAATALTDQVDAASREALQLLHVIGARAGGPITIPDKPAPWISQQIHALSQAILTGTARTCPHVTTAPSVLHAAVWAPGVLTCPDCRHLLAPSPLEDHICDRCRTAVHALTPCMVASGPVLLGFGLCPPCTLAVAPSRPLRP